MFQPPFVLLGVKCQVSSQTRERGFGDEGSTLSVLLTHFRSVSVSIKLYKPAPIAYSPLMDT